MVGGAATTVAALRVFTSSTSLIIPISFSKEGIAPIGLPELCPPGAGAPPAGTPDIVIVTGMSWVL